MLLTFTDKMKEFNESIIVGLMVLLPLRIRIVGIHNAGNKFRSLILFSSKKSITKYMYILYYYDIHIYIYIIYYTGCPILSVPF